MFLKKIEDIDKTTLFQKYEELNAEINIEFIISLKELLDNKRLFLKNDLFYNTKLFEEIQYKNIYLNRILKNKIE